MPKRPSRRGLLLGIACGLPALARRHVPPAVKVLRPTCLLPAPGGARIVRVDTCGRITTFTYEYDPWRRDTGVWPCARGLITTATDEGGRLESASPGGRPISSGGAPVFFYEGWQLGASRVDPLQTVTTYVYDCETGSFDIRQAGEEEPEEKQPEDQG